MAQKYDVLVIGAGPAGYVAAIRAAQLGLSTVCIDKWLDAAGQPSLGGTCLNVGCIPSKALLDSSHKYEEARKSFEAHGISTGEVSIDVSAMIKRKELIIKKLTTGIKGLFKANGVTSLAGTARITAAKQVEFVAHDGVKKTIEVANIVVATGSESIDIPPTPVNGDTIVDNKGALAFQSVPNKVGGNWRGSDWSGTWQCVESFRFRGSDPGSAGRFSADGGSTNRQGCAEKL